VVAPHGPLSAIVRRGPLVCALDNSPESGHVASVATRFALALGGQLRLVPTPPSEPLTDVPEIAPKLGATLLVASAQGEPGRIRGLLEAADIPVMLIP
jgi:hypothetical protein